MNPRPDSLNVAALGPNPVPIHQQVLDILHLSIPSSFDDPVCHGKSFLPRALRFLICNCQFHTINRNINIIYIETMFRKSSLLLRMRHLVWSIIHHPSPFVRPDFKPAKKNTALMLTRNFKFMSIINPLKSLNAMV